MSTFTPGPWRAKRQAYWTDSPILIQQEDGIRVLAIVHQDLGTAIPNARLIAAAPTAYELLEKWRYRECGWDYKVGTLRKCVECGGYEKSFGYDGAQIGCTDDCKLATYFRTVEDEWDEVIK